MKSGHGADCYAHDPQGNAEDLKKLLEKELFREGPGLTKALEVLARDPKKAKVSACSHAPANQ
jgi:hypothetical protein